MRVAIQNPFAGQWVAETELSRRLYLAAVGLGWEAAEVHTAADLKAVQPDFVIALHNNSPKLAEYPTYGCMWNPPAFFEGTERYVKQVLTYDGYLTSSKAIDRWLHHLLYTTPKPFFTAPFYTSCPRCSYLPPQLEQPQLMYLGSNWDGSRFQDLFERLDSLDYMAIYGNPDGWRYLTSAYRGTLPYDGESVLKALNQAGVGLCLHRAEHRQAALPSMRIFEIVAAGAVAICGEHPFIRDAFGDSVFYINPEDGSAKQVDRISDYMQWIRQNPQAAVEMSAAAHDIFLRQFTLEKLLADLVPHHQALMERRRCTLTHSPTVQIFLNWESGCPDALEASLQSIARQTYPNCSVTIAHSEPNLNLDNQLSLIKFPVQLLELSHLNQSASLWAKLNAVRTEYFTFLSSDHCIHPNHIHSLVSLLNQNPDQGAAYSGVLDQPIFFQPFNLDQLLTFNFHISLSCLMVRRSLLDPILQQDPQLDRYAEWCFLLHLAQRTPFLFSYEATCEVQAAADRPSLAALQDWSSELSRLRFIFWQQEFAPGKTLTVQPALQPAIAEPDATLRSQLQVAQATITAMETSKFWQLRRAWFRVKRAIGLPARD